MFSHAPSALLHSAVSRPPNFCFAKPAKKNCKEALARGSLMPATASLRAAENLGMENTLTCTCSLSCSSMNEACESCQREWALWREEEERQARAEAACMSSAKFMATVEELFGHEAPEEFTAPQLFGKMRRLNAALWSAA